jgi:hypothetical protein
MMRFVLAVFALLAIKSMPVTQTEQPIDADLPSQTTVAAVGWLDGGGATGIGPQ